MGWIPKSCYKVEENFKSQVDFPLPLTCPPSVNRTVEGFCLLLLFSSISRLEQQEKSQISLWILTFRGFPTPENITQAVSANKKSIPVSKPHLSWCLLPPSESLAASFVVAAVVGALHLLASLPQWSRGPIKATRGLSYLTKQNLLLVIQVLDDKWSSMNCLWIGYYPPHHKML